MSTKEDVIRIVTQITGHEDIDENTNFSDLDFDTLDELELEYLLEDQCGYDHDNDEHISKHFKTVGDLIKEVEHDPK